MKIEGTSRKINTILMFLGTRLYLNATMRIVDTVSSVQEIAYSFSIDVVAKSSKILTDVLYLSLSFIVSKLKS